MLFLLQPQFFFLTSLYILLQYYADRTNNIALP